MHPPVGLTLRDGRRRPPPRRVSMRTSLSISPMIVLVSYGLGELDLGKVRACALCGCLHESKTAPRLRRAARSENRPRFQRIILRCSPERVSHGCPGSGRRLRLSGRVQCRSSAHAPQENAFGCPCSRQYLAVRCTRVYRKLQYFRHQPLGALVRASGQRASNQKCQIHGIAVSCTYSTRLC